jgi:hypothetical protein
MQTLTESFVDSLAPNAAAIKNGWGLVKKNQFVLLNKSEDGTLLFGECKGSGKSNYQTSVDFIQEVPVARCTCPSRQFPCKHSLGLMYSYVNGATFNVADIPEDIMEKREKSVQRQEKKKEQAAAPKKVNKTALQKKIKAQLNGLEIFERQIHQLVRTGIATIGPKKLKAIEETVKQLGNDYLKELQHELRELILLWDQKNLLEEQLYSLAYEKLQLLYSISKKGKQHLAQKLEDEEMLPDIESSIEEKLGHIWQLAELRELNSLLYNAQLVQLSFSSKKSEARKEWIDEGIWLEITNGNLYYTKNYRPFRAAKQMKEEDSIFHIVQTNELFIYPGEGSKRVRWEDYQFIGLPDSNKILEFAKPNVTEVIKQVRNQLKLPLADKHPLALIAFSKIGMVEGEWMLEDCNGVRLTLNDRYIHETATLPLLDLLSNKELENGAMLVKFDHNLETGVLAAKPLSIITTNRIVRLVG